MSSYCGYSDYRGGYMGLVAMILAVIFILLVASCRGCMVDDSSAVSALEKQGFSEIKIESKAIFLVGFRGCSSHDAAKFEASAKNPAGRHVSDIYVCVGWPFKGATIRTD